MKILKLLLLLFMLAASIYITDTGLTYMNTAGLDFMRLIAGIIMFFTGILMFTGALILLIFTE